MPAGRRKKSGGGFRQACSMPLSLQRLALGGNIAGEQEANVAFCDGGDRSGWACLPHLPFRRRGFAYAVLS